MLKDALLQSSKQECARARGIVHRSNDATVMDATIKSSKGERALGMGQKSNYVAVKYIRKKLKGVCIRHGAQIKLCNSEGCTKHVIDKECV